MIKYLFLVGAGLAINQMSEYGSAKSKLKVQFDRIEKDKIDLFNARLGLSLLIGNNNRFPIEVYNVIGHLILGTIRIPVTRNILLELLPNQKVKASFKLQLEYDDILISLSNMFQRGQRPERFYFDGWINGNADGIPFQLPVQHEIPLQL